MYIFSNIFLIDESLIKLFLFTTLISLISQLGDIIVSYFKSQTSQATIEQEEAGRYHGPGEEGRDEKEREEEAQRDDGRRGRRFEHRESADEMERLRRRVQLPRAYGVESTVNFFARVFI